MRYYNLKNVNVKKIISKREISFSYTIYFDMNCSVWTFAICKKDACAVLAHQNLSAMYDGINSALGKAINNR